MTSRPPLNAVFVFCAAARRASFKGAAEELCVTPGAVSRQIQALENYLGQPLFERSFRAVQLTRAGQKLYSRVSEKMHSIDAEIDLLRGDGRKAMVRVDAGVTFAMYWLIPRLSSFHAANPGIEIQISTSKGPVNMSEQFDLHIRRNPKDFATLKPERFLDEYSIIVASSKLDQSSAKLSTQRLGQHQGIAAKSRPDLWRTWSEFHGLAAADVKPTLELDNTVLAIQAAVEGLGVMVVPAIFVGNLLDRKALMTLGRDRVQTGSYFILKRARRDSIATQTFINWLHFIAQQSES